MTYRPEPVIHLTKDASQNIGGANGTATAISWDDDSVIRKDGNYTHEDTTNPSRIVVTEAGRYHIKANVAWNNTGSARCTMYGIVRVDGSTDVVRAADYGYSRGNAYNDNNCAIDTEIELTAGQYIEIITIVDDTDATYTVSTNVTECELIMRRVGN